MLTPPVVPASITAAGFDGKNIWPTRFKAHKCARASHIAVGFCLMLPRALGRMSTIFIIIAAVVLVAPPAECPSCRDDSVCSHQGRAPRP